ncbi:hypothetical protein MesoLjLc_45920 [Mesorhizobium sp. L-8-10]|uniref:hypothetical protein n=1 Tax=Mesorhizobium sp. L-8-10 TaxID=2744523 RepID=UPI001927ECC3|nr:hypothetical protein [Mesorhizobium sp. L-8-10]BCH32662.1 hypothetical protein MesoLjLc_45920 [Mesorhizobium sp. L-8-10]
MNAHTPLLKPYGCPAGIAPHEWRRAVEIRLEELLDQSMALITALDMMEVDADFEPYLAGTGGDDREDENEHWDGNPDDEDSHDAEADPAEWGVADEDALHAIMPY